MVKHFYFPSLQEYRERHSSWRLEHGGLARCDDPDKVSVVTVTYNSATTLSRTMESVSGQTFRCVEYIIVDGGSTDRTVNIIEEGAAAVTVWLSAPDAGISDAFNKGLSLATGEYIAIVNADDWLSPDNLRFAVETLKATNGDFVFGDQIMHSDDGGTYKYCGDPQYRKLIRKRMPALNHPTVVVRREAYERAGLFVRELRYAMDYELLLRFHRFGLRGIYDARIVGHMSLSGASDKNYLEGLKECRDIAVVHGLPPSEANREYFYSATKGVVRRGMQRFLPKGIVDRLWQIVNKQFSPQSSAKL